MKLGKHRRYLIYNSSFANSPAKLSRLKLKLSWHYISKRVERLKAIREICWLSFINISVISSFINISVISSFASVSYQENKLTLPYYLITLYVHEAWKTPAVYMCRMTNPTNFRQ